MPEATPGFDPTDMGVADSARSLRLLFVDHSSEPGGAELALVRMTPQLRKHGIEVHLCLGSQGPVSDLALEAGAQVHVIELDEALRNHRRESIRPLRDLVSFLPAIGGAAISVSGLARAIDADAIVANSMKAFVYASLAARLSGRPLVWDVHDVPRPPYFTKRGSVLYDAMQATFRPRAVLVHSRYVRNSLRFTRNVTVLPQGIDLRRKESPVSSVGPLRLGMAARLAPWKGQLTAIRAMPLVRETLPDARLDLAGAALFGESAYEQFLVNEIARLGLEEAVSLVGHVADPVAFYESVDVALHCSVVPEPFGNSVLDALAAGRPVIASADGGVAEILAGCEASRLVTPDAPAALAKSILSLAGEGRAKLQQLGGIARRHASRYALDSVAPYVARFYSDTVKPRAPHHALH